MKKTSVVLLAALCATSFVFAGGNLVTATDSQVPTSECDKKKDCDKKKKDKKKKDCGDKKTDCGKKKKKDTETKE